MAFRVLMTVMGSALSLATSSGCTELLPQVFSDDDDSAGGSGVTAMESPSSSTDRSVDPDDSTASADDSSSTTGGSTTGGTGEPGGWCHEVVLAGHPLGPLSDVPVRVHLDPALRDTIGEPEGLRFYDRAGDRARDRAGAGAGPSGSVLPSEVESWTAAGAEIWVRALLVDTGPVSISMCYEVAEPPTPLRPSLVWGDALGVWHLSDGLVDSGGGGHHGLSMGATAGPGRIGGGHAYDGNVYDDLPPMGSSSEGTVQLWLRPAAVQPGSMGGSLAVFFHASPDLGANGFGNGTDELYCALRLLDPVRLQCRSFDGDDDMVDLSVYQEGSWLDEQWVHLSATWSDSDDRARLYVDGVEVDEDVTLPMSFALDQLLRLGGIADFGERSFGGELDEVRLYDRPLSAARIGIEYAAQQPGFATVGEAQPAI